MRRITNAEQHKEKKASATVGMSGIISGRHLIGRRVGYGGRVGARRREGHKMPFVFVKTAPGGSVPFQTAREESNFLKRGFEH